MVANKEQVAALVDMFHTGVRQEYARGEFLVRPGSQPPGVFYVESGLVKAYDITKYGEENLLILRSDGEILGLTWALTRQDRDVIYTALAPTVVWVVSRDRFITHIQEHPEAAVPVVSLLADMYRLHGERIITLEYRTVRERLASFLLGIAERFGTPVEDGVLIKAPLRHQDIASSISATRETTSRTLSELEHKGIIASRQSHFVVLDTEALRNFIQ